MQQLFHRYASVSRSINNLKSFNYYIYYGYILGWSTKNEFSNFFARQADSGSNWVKKCVQNLRSIEQYLQVAQQSTSYEIFPMRRLRIMTMVL